MNEFERRALRAKWLLLAGFVHSDEKGPWLVGRYLRYMDISLQEERNWLKDFKFSPALSVEQQVIDERIINRIKNMRRVWSGKVIIDDWDKYEEAAETPRVHRHRRRLQL